VPLAIEIVALVIGALALGALLMRVPASSERRPHRRRGPGATASPRPADLEQIERLVSIAQGSASDVHLQLRPLLRLIAAGKLARRQIVLDRDLGAARMVLGDDLWELVNPERPPPTDPRAPGISLTRLTASVEKLDSL